MAAPRPITAGYHDQPFAAGSATFEISLRLRPLGGGRGGS